MSFFKNSEINDLLKFDQFLKYASNIGTWSFNIFVSLILSLFFMVEREKIKEFSQSFKIVRLPYYIGIQKILE